MDRTLTIKNIVGERLKRHNEIQSRLSAVNALLASLEDLKDRSVTHQRNLHDDVKVCSLLRGLDAKVAEAIDRAGRLAEELRRLKNRTGRDTLNIGVVGKPKQGKSTFLQALTGLEEAIIPTGKDFVTGACSYLRHDPTVVPGDAYAIITPYSRREFMDEVLAPFCQKFRLVLNSLDDLPNLELPEDSSLTETEKFELERLHGLKADYAEYKELLGQESIRIPKQEIRRYVAQCDETTTIKYSNWYAVKRAEIHCRFPQDDIGDVTICDTPGLGDFTPGAQAALLEKLSMDMDVAFFLKRPQGKETIEPDDTEFYDVIKAANPLIGVQDWAYMLLNCSAADPASSTFERNLNTKLPTRLSVMQVDAKDKQAVSSAFDTILQDVVGQIPRLDAKLMGSYAERLADVQQSVTEVLQAARSVFVSATGPCAGVEMDADVNALLKSFFKKIDAYKEDLDNNGLRSLAPKIDEVLQSMKANPPMFEYSLMDAKEDTSLWYSECRNMMRARFIREFAHVDAAMQELVSQVRNHLEEILLSTGRLAFVCEDDGRENFWSDLRARLAGELGDNAEPLCQAIDNVISIRLDFRAFILPRLTFITKRLSNAFTSEDESFLNSVCNLNDKDEKMKALKNKLQSTWSWAVATAGELFDPEDGDLNDILTTPKSAMVAMLDEFWLLWTRSGGKEHADAVWRNFYRSHAREVWPEKFEGNSSLIAIARSWNNAVEALETAAGKLR